MRRMFLGLAGVLLAGFVMTLTPGCGGNDGLSKMPEVKQNPPMTSMPGFDEKSGQMKTDKTK